MREFFSSELGYVVLLFALFVVPKILQRYRLPSAVTSLALGAAAFIGLGLFVDDPTVQLLATFGIVALFLFAGLEVDGGELLRGARVIGQHLVVRTALLIAGTWIVMRLLGLGLRPASLVALALLTPSTGFILHSLHAFGLTTQEQFWVKSKAIATEILALGTLFVALRSTSLGELAWSGGALIGLIVLLPLLFRVFAERIAPYAPKSEFAFLLMLAVVFAFATRRLGVYYLVGAFLVGVAARRFREQLPAMASENMLHAVETFASVFAPFYFFNAGVHLNREDFGVQSLLLGAVFLGAAMPLGVLTVALHRKLVLKEDMRRGLRVGFSLAPTLVFTLVLAEILRDRFHVPEHVFGGLVVYTLANTLLPGLMLANAPPAYDAPTLVAGPAMPAADAEPYGG